MDLTIYWGAVFWMLKAWLGSSPTIHAVSRLCLISAGVQIPVELNLVHRSSR